jgi:hypothetical protein
MLTYSIVNLSCLEYLNIKLKNKENVFIYYKSNKLHLVLILQMNIISYCTLLFNLYSN